MNPIPLPRPLTKAEWLKRCETAYDIGLTDRSQMVMLERWLDFVMRLEHTFFSHGQSEFLTCWQFLEEEKERIQENNGHTLASDHQGYNMIKFAAILSNYCQSCAEDPTAWHTRACFTKEHQLVSSLPVAANPPQKKE